MFSKLEFLAQAPLILAYFLVFGPCRYLLRCLGLDHRRDEQWLMELPSDISGSICIVTGSNTGIGFETALELSARHAQRVILACRSREKGEAAARAINQRTGTFSARWMALDLSNLSSVVDFCERFQREEGDHLDLLINNAGVNTKGMTADGLNESFQINYLGHYILTRLLLGLLTAPCTSVGNRNHFFSETSRVVNLSSVMHHTGGTNFSASAYGKGLTSCYDDSKLFMNLLTLELNRRYRRSASGTKRSMLALSVNPGNLLITFATELNIFGPCTSHQYLLRNALC